MTLILGIGAAAAAALAIYQSLRGRGEQFANIQITEARRAAGIVNAVAYGLAVLLDAISLRRSATYTPMVATPVVATPVPTQITVPARIGGRREDDDD